MLNIGKVMKQLEQSFIADGKVNWYTTLKIIYSYFIMVNMPDLGHFIPTSFQVRTQELSVHMFNNEHIEHRRHGQ